MITYGAGWTGPVGLGGKSRRGHALVGKTPLIVAPVIVSAALLFAAFWFGRLWERAGRRYASRFIDPVLHADLVELVRRILVPTDVEQGCFLPDPVRERAAKLVALADEQAANRKREELRRRGF
jgi:hypothetical protein